MIWAHPFIKVLVILIQIIYSWQECLKFITQSCNRISFCSYLVHLCEYVKLYKNATWFSIWCNNEMWFYQVLLRILKSFYDQTWSNAFYQDHWALNWLYFVRIHQNTFIFGFSSPLLDIHTLKDIFEVSQPRKCILASQMLNLKLWQFLKWFLHSKIIW